MSLGAESQLASVASKASQRGVFGTLQLGRSALADRWSKLSLGSQFALTAAAVILVGMFALGTWINDRIRTGVVQNSAANAALYLVSFLEPHIQPMSSSPSLPKASHEQIDLVFQRLSQQRGIIGVKVWGRGGLLVYSSDKQRTGQVFPESAKLRSAWLGNIEPEFDDLDDVESEVERRLNVPMLEVYAPMRDVVTKEVIAVAEVYEVATTLQSELRDTFYKTV
ncbi:MAG: hypothetical protein K2Y05_12435, partial [Hyphomicrobiaceae bacterium]|nr:hypothetical protein [Hyphomicrobiaceae bacterium]